MTAIDLFAGCGGFSLGFTQAGFHVRTAVEIDPDIAETYRRNHADTHVIVEDVRNVDIFQKGDSDIIIGGPPCQGFSMAGARIRAGFVDDPRNYLFRRYIEIVSTVRPQMFFMENVKGLCTFQNGAVLEEIMERFSTLSPPYHVYPRLVNAQDFGIPQKRERLLLIGTVRPIEDMDELWAQTRAELLAEDAHYFDTVCVRDAIGNLSTAAWNGTVPNPPPQTYYQRHLSRRTLFCTTTHGAGTPPWLWIGCAGWETGRTPPHWTSRSTPSTEEPMAVCAGTGLPRPSPPASTRLPLAALPTRTRTGR